MHDREHGLFGSISHEAVIMKNKTRRKKKVNFFNVSSVDKKFSWVVLLVFVEHIAFFCLVIDVLRAEITLEDNFLFFTF